MSKGYFIYCFNVTEDNENVNHNLFSPSISLGLNSMLPCINKHSGYLKRENPTYPWRSVYRHSILKDKLHF